MNTFRWVAGVSLGMLVEWMAVEDAGFWWRAMFLAGIAVTSQSWPGVVRYINDDKPATV